jgi:transcriptional regulator with XRE-family HTH domain
MATIQLRIRELRLERGLTQVQLAERCGMPQSTISRIESGSTTGVDFETLNRVAQALGVHPADLIAFDQVVFDYRGRSYVVRDVTQEGETVPEGATTVWGIKGTDITFGTTSDADAGAVIKKAKRELTKRAR